MRDLFTLANAFKEGDLPVGGTRDDQVRADARRALLAVSVGDIRRAALVDDGVTEMIERSRDRSRDGELDRLTVADLQRTLIGPGGEAWARAHRHALGSEAIAAVTKVMTDDELSVVARRLFNPHPGPGVAIGSPRHFGSRIQPNSPGDDATEILFSILEGLSFGCGDVIIGLNPASDDVETIVELERLLARVVERLELPTRFCVLSDILKQRQAQARTRVDVGFQSLAGTSAALAGMVGLDADGVLDLARGFDGLYFETGQGSAVTNGTAQGVDMVTLEARAYGLARAIQQATGVWTIVNDVAGFIGPEVFRTGAQLERACLEDMVMAKLHGLTMGLDVCATFHMGIAPTDLRTLTARIVERAAPAYLMAVAGNADPMLGYLTTSFREHPELRRRSQRTTTSAMQAQLDKLPKDVPSLYALYSGGTADEGRRILVGLRAHGFDLGSGDAGVPLVETRLQAIYEHARLALYAPLDDVVVRDACPRVVRVRTRAADREDYLAHPAAGEYLRAQDQQAISAMYPARRPQAQIVVSDGLNANAVNEHVKAVLPTLRRALSDAGIEAGAVDVVVTNGRVRAGYHVGQLLDVPVIVHFVGERPGTGLNTLSAYVTYGRDERGAPRWSPDLDHSCTNAVCGIHPRGKTAEAAVSEIARLVSRMLAQRRSGVLLA